MRGSFPPGRVNAPAPLAPKEECGWRAHSHLFARAEERLAQTEVGRRQDAPGLEGTQAILMVGRKLYVS